MYQFLKPDHGHFDEAGDEAEASTMNKENHYSRIKAGKK
jgi:hypothetical protein